MVEPDFDVLVQVFDGRAGVGHTGRHHKRVEDLTPVAALNGWRRRV